MSISEAKDRLVAKLAEMGVKRVVIEYDGSGDSGQVTSVAAFTGDKSEEKGGPNYYGQDVDEIVRAQRFPDQIPMQVAGRLLGEEDTLLSSQLEEFAYQAIAEAGLGDWCNNDGGGGVMTILVEAGADSDGEEFEAQTISIRHFTRRTEHDYESATL